MHVLRDTGLIQPDSCSRFEMDGWIQERKGEAALIIRTILYVSISRAAFVLFDGTKDHTQVTVTGLGRRSMIESIGSSRLMHGDA